MLLRFRIDILYLENLQGLHYFTILRLIMTFHSTKNSCELTDQFGHDTNLTKNGVMTTVVGGDVMWPIGH